MNSRSLLTLSLIVLLGGTGSLAPLPPSLSQPATNRPLILFRTKSYVVQITWRGTQPLLSVSQNGWRVLNNVPARVTPKRGVADDWTTYVGNSGDYQAIVRVGPAGSGAIAVTQAGKRLTEEYATNSLNKPEANEKVPQQDGTVLTMETKEYAVRVYRQDGELRMNLYDRKKGAIALNQVPVTLVNSTSGTIYRYDGDTSIQVRENVQGEKVLYILRDNAIQYRSEGY